MAEFNEIETEIPDLGIAVMIYPPDDRTNHPSVTVWTSSWKKLAHFALPIGTPLEEVPDLLEAKFHAATEDLRAQIAEKTEK